MDREEPPVGQSAGPSTDASNTPVVDPTQNVLDLVDAAIRRQDDLRNVSEDYHERIRQADLKFLEERDRRLTEVAAEREKALKIKDEGDAKAARIKEDADKEARELAREAQRYKDEQANKLREQIAAERGDYVSLLAFKPIADYVTAQQARQEGNFQFRNETRLNLNVLLSVAGLLLTVLVVSIAFIGR